MKAILRSSCLCLFYLIQTFIKCLLYATQHSWSFPACHLIQSTLVQIHMPLVCNKYFFCVCVASFRFLLEMCAILKSLSFYPPRTVPCLSPGPGVSEFPPGAFLVSSLLALQPLPTKHPFLSVHSSHWLLISRSSAL